MGPTQSPYWSPSQWVIPAVQAVVEGLAIQLPHYRVGSLDWVDCPPVESDQEAFLRCKHSHFTRTHAPQHTHLIDPDACLDQDGFAVSNDCICHPTFAAAKKNTTFFTHISHTKPHTLRSYSAGYCSYLLV